MKITRRQLRRIIKEELSREQVEPERFKSFRDAVAAGTDMVLGHDPSQKLGTTLPWEVRVVLIDPGSLDGEYALYAMKDHDDRYDGKGKAIAAVPRDGDVRHGKQIG